VKKKQSKLLTFIAPVGIFLLMVGSKMKALLLVASKWLTFAKLGWLSAKCMSLWLSLTLYGVVFGWSFAWMLIIVLLCHEGGHWIWMQAYRLNPGWPTFIPFLGAFVAMKKLPKDEASHAWVAMAGPLIGGVTSGIFFWAGAITDNNWLMATGNLGFILNLIQLIPARPLDGGFVITAISKKILIPGILFLVLFAVYRQSVLLFFIGIISIFELLDTITGSRQMELRASTSEAKTLGELIREIEKLPNSEVMKPASMDQRWLIGISYIVLAASLGQLYTVSSSLLPNLHR